MEAIMRAGRVYTAVFALILCISSAECTVGVYDRSGHLLNEVVYLDDAYAVQMPGGCFVGRAGNLVVFPVGGKNAYGGENLDISYGSKLCSWLSDIRRMHNELKRPWEDAQLARRKDISFFNIYRRIREYFRGFPNIKIQVTLKYIDFYNKDNFGNPLPYMRAIFEYVGPSSTEGHNLFAHLDGKTFGSDPYGRESETVTLLLSPPASFNQPLKAAASTSNVLYSIFSGAFDSKKMTFEDKAFTNGPDIYGALTAKLTLYGKIGDFWINGPYCYYTPIFRVQWNLAGKSVCDVLHAKADSDVFKAYAASTLDTVAFHITKFELFNDSVPSMWVSVNEGVFLTENASPYLYFQIDTNPQNVPNYERSKNIKTGTRAANLLLSGLRGLKKAFSDDSKAKTGEQINTKHSGQKVYPTLPPEIEIPSYTPFSRHPPYNPFAPSAPPEPSDPYAPSAPPEPFYPYAPSAPPTQPSPCIPRGTPYPVHYPIPTKTKPSYGFRSDIAKSPPVGFERYEKH